MKKTLMIVFGVAILFGIGVGCSSVENQKTNHVLPPSSEKNSASSSSTAHFETGYESSSDLLQKIFEEKTLSSSSSVFAFTAVYPVVGQSKIDEQIFRYIKNLEKTIKSSAEKDVRLKNKAREDQTYNLEVDYLVEAYSPKLVSLTFLSTGYYGGAHPYHYVQSFLFDRDTGKNLELRDIFLLNTDYLKKISDYSIRILLENDSEMVSNKEDVLEGAGPNPKNFNIFTFSNQVMKMYFNEYQVATYAYGLKTVEIPLVELDKLLKPELAQKISSLTVLNHDKE